MLTPKKRAEAVRRAAWRLQGSVVEDCVLYLIEQALVKAEQQGERRARETVSPKC